LARRPQLAVVAAGLAVLLVVLAIVVTIYDQRRAGVNAPQVTGSAEPELVAELARWTKLFPVCDASLYGDLATHRKVSCQHVASSGQCCNADLELYKFLGSDDTSVGLNRYATTPGHEVTWLPEVPTLARNVRPAPSRFGHVELPDNRRRLIWVGPDGDIVGIFTLTYPTDPAYTTATWDDVYRIWARPGP
jgi:hypothetical protein